MIESAERALVALRRILRVTESHSRVLSRDLGATASQVVVLRMLGHEGEMMAGQIADRARFSQATVSTLLDGLETSGLVLRKRGTEDRRQVWVSLTKEGRRFLDELPDLLQERFAHRFEKLPGWEQGYLVAALERVTSLLDAEEIDASPVLDIGAITRAPRTQPTPITDRRPRRRRT